MVGSSDTMGSVTALLQIRLQGSSAEDLLFWLQMAVLMAGLLWCLALFSVVVFGGWYVARHPQTGDDQVIRRLVQILSLLTLGLTEPELGHSFQERGCGMDKQEAERLVAAIEGLHVAWLAVDRIVFNESRGAYELQCSYRGLAGFLGAKAIWRTR